MNMTRHFERVLSNFPFSPQGPANTVLRIQAVSSDEPDVRESVFPDPVDVKAIGIVMQEAGSSDSCFQVEGFWGMWQYENNDWKLTPSPVTLLCFGPGFEGLELSDGSRENMRIEFGLESQFLVRPVGPGRHAARAGAAPATRNRQGAGQPRRARTPAGPRRGARWQQPGRICANDRGRNAEVGARGEGLGGAGGLRF